MKTKTKEGNEIEENTFVEIKMLFKKKFESEEECEKETCETFLVLTKIVALVLEHNEKSDSIFLNIYGLNREAYPDNLEFGNQKLN